MIQLEKLYDCAEKYLLDEPDWEGFAASFCDIFEASFALYCNVDDAREDAVPTVDVIATNDPDCLAEFNEARLLGPIPIKEASLPKLEPHRRSDEISDEEVRKLGHYYEFMKRHNVFYLMMVPAELPDGRLLSLTLWRPESGEDFSDIEKQRLALFMRHLLVLVREPQAAVTTERKALDKFGDKYGLTKAELDVLQELLLGKSLREMSETSERSYSTVRWHVRNILSKCQVRSQKNLLREFYALISR